MHNGCVKTLSNGTVSTYSEVRTNCNNEDDVNWFCKNCLQNLCDDCKKMHSKIPSLKTHEIGTIGDGYTVDRSAKLLCDDHGELIQLRCKTCSVNCCLKCIAANHHNHERIDMDKFAKEKEKEFRMLLQSKEIFIANVAECRRQIEDVRERNKSVTTRNIDDINETFEKIKKEKDDLVSEIEEQHQVNEKESSEKLYQLETIENDISVKILEYSSQLSTKSGVSLVHFVEKAEEDILSSTFPVSLDISRACKLESGSRNVDASQIFGRLKSAERTHIGISKKKNETTNKTTSISVISKFHHITVPQAWPWVFCITNTNDDLAWISNNKTLLALVDKSGTTHRRIELYNIDIIFNTILPSGDVLISCGASKPHTTIIRRIGPSDRVSVFADVKEVVYDMRVVRNENIVALVVIGFVPVLYDVVMNKTLFRVRPIFIKFGCKSEINV